MQICNTSHRLDPSDLELHLRSDFELVTASVQVKLPKVYILGTTAAAASRLMAALSNQQSHKGTPAPLSSMQPAEITLDGSRWCNLLAAPAATPKMATEALTLSLASQRTSIQAQPLGPLASASRLLEVRSDLVTVAGIAYHRPRPSNVALALSFHINLRID